jgi:hypothetical protein
VRGSRCSTGIGSRVMMVYTDRHLEGLVATASLFDGRRCRRSGGG